MRVTKLGICAVGLVKVDGRLQEKPVWFVRIASLVNTRDLHRQQTRVTECPIIGGLAGQQLWQAGTK